MPNPPPPERRQVPNNLIVELMSQIDNKLDNVIESNRDFRESLIRMEEAFPEKDFQGHKEYHEAKIASIQARKAFYDKLTFELTKWGLIGFAAWLFIDAWKAFLRGPG